jgi:hypothetical protein
MAGNPLDNRRACFTVVNGWPEDVPITFAGLVQKSVMATDALDKSVSIRVGSLGTGINTGFDIIPAMCPVIWDFPGYTTIEGSRTPIFRIKGTSPQCFFPETKPLRRGSVVEILRGLTNKFFVSCYAQYNNTHADAKDATKRESWQIVRTYVRTTDAAKARVEADMANAHEVDVVIRSTRHTRSILRRFVNMLLCIVNAHDRTLDWLAPPTQKRAMELLSSSSETSSTSSLDITSYHHSRKLLNLTMAEASTAFNAGAGEIFYDYILMFTAELMKELNKRYMGLSMKLSPSGHELDLLMKRACYGM